MRKFNLLVALSLIVGTLMLPAAALAAPPQCHIVNQTSDVKFDNLQAAVDAASPGDTLKLKGTCVGPTTIAKDLTIEGKSNPAFGPATLDAQGAAGSSVVRINSANVTLQGLTITGGTGWAPAPGAPPWAAAASLRFSAVVALLRSMIAQSLATPLLVPSPVAAASSRLAPTWY